MGLKNTKQNSIANDFWSDDKVIDFVNWYLKLNKLGFKYTLENNEILESFKRGDDVSLWHRDPLEGLENICDEDSEIEFYPCSGCDGHDACEDFGCAIKAGIIEDPYI